MQVGNVFIDLKVVGYDKDNIVTLNNMQNMQITETAGTSLPYVVGTFFTFDKNLADYFQLNNTLQLGIGTTIDDVEYYTVHLIDSPKDQDPSGNGWKVEFGGFIGPTTYMMDKISDSYKGNSRLVAKQVIKKNFGIEPDINFLTVNENQVIWRQTYETTASFLVNTLLHMDIRPSFPLFSFDKKGKFHIKSFDKVIQGSHKVTFVPTVPSKADEIQYLNNFNVDSFKSEYNMYSGYNKVTEVCDATSGIPKYVIDDNIPILASTQQSEQSGAGNRATLNQIQSTNVHKTYNEAFAHNTNRLLSMSSMLGCLKLANGFYKNLAPLDLVFVDTGRESGSDGTINGLYLIDTIVTEISFTTTTITTYVYVTRDNKNNVENYITQKRKKIKLNKKLIEKLAQAVSDVMAATALCSNIMSGQYLEELRSFVISTKNSFLKIFSVADVRLNFTGQIKYIQNALFVGNSLMNSLLYGIFPYEIASTLSDFLIRKPTTRMLLGDYIADYVPVPLQTPISKLTDSLCNVHDSLNSIAEANNVSTGVIREEIVASTSLAASEADDRVLGIIQQFENNTTGLDVPFPLITLTESQKLLPEVELMKYVADETILNLTDLGYMEGIDTDEFEKVLMGTQPIEFSMIQKINENAGNTMSYRFWGTFGQGSEALYAWVSGEDAVYTKILDLKQFTRLFNGDYSPYSGTSFKIDTKDGGENYHVYKAEGTELVETERNESLDVNSNVLAQLTSFYINKSYRDRFRTIPCTKLISATQNSRIFFACPKKESNLKFYINSKRVNLESFPIDLGYRDSYGNVITYLVYFTDTGFNSNSVLFEVRQ